MFCFMVKRRLYEFIEGNLSEIPAEKIKSHLSRCPNCAGEYTRMQKLLSLAAQKKAPQPEPGFWAGFDRRLGQRLSQEQIMPQEFKLHPDYSPQPNLRPVYALVSVFIILLVLSFYLFGGLPTRARLSVLSEQRLVNDIEVLEELTGEFVILDDEDILLDELGLLEDLS